jgi:hypothetical protein
VLSAYSGAKFIGIDVHGHARAYAADGSSIGEFKTRKSFLGSEHARALLTVPYAQRLQRCSRGCRHRALRCECSKVPFATIVRGRPALPRPSCLDLARAAAPGWSVMNEPGSRTQTPGAVRQARLADKSGGHFPRAPTVPRPHQPEQHLRPQWAERRPA